MLKQVIPNILNQGRATVKYKVKVLMQKDSRFITNEDRETIYQNCIGADENWIVITHESITMAQTAKYLGSKGSDKTIVLVGAIVPGNKKSSDAPFNLGAAMMAVQLLPKGVYVIMNGRVFSWNNVYKNFRTGKFYSVR